MALEDLANVVVSTEGPALTQVGFGVPLFLAYHTHYTDLVREYTSLAGMTTDGFTSSEPAYLMASACFSQSPRVKKVKIGRLTVGAVQSVKITPIAQTLASVYTITITKAGVPHVITFTSANGDTAADNVDDFVAAVTTAAISGVTATDNVTYATITMAAGVYIYLSAWSVLRFQVEENAANYSTPIADMLDAIDLYDSDWYGLATEIPSEAIVEAIASWIESRGLGIFITHSSDWRIPEVGQTADVASDLQDSAYTRTALIYSATNTASYAGCAALGERLPHDPGAAGAGGTFHGKTLTGVAVDALTPTLKSGARAKNVMVYITTAGINHTLDGKSASGEYLDVVRFLDWFRIRSEERIAAAILGNDKIPFTDGGVGVIVAALEAQAQAGVTAGGFSPDPAPVIVAPKVADISSADKAARNLTGITGSATLAGAIHLVDPISFSVST
jgi:hypothetical protein